MAKTATMQIPTIVGVVLPLAMVKQLQDITITRKCSLSSVMRELVIAGIQATNLIDIPTVTAVEPGKLPGQDAVINDTAQDVVINQ